MRCDRRYVSSMSTSSLFFTHGVCVPFFLLTSFLTYVFSSFRPSSLFPSLFFPSFPSFLPFPSLLFPSNFRGSTITLLYEAGFEELLNDSDFAVRNTAAGAIRFLHPEEHDHDAIVPGRKNMMKK